MSTNLQNISKSFPHHHLTPIHGTPTYESIQTLQTEINANACSVRLNLGGGMNGHLGLTIPDTEYTKQTGHSFIRPSYQCIVPTFPKGATTTVLQSHQIRNNALLTIFITCNKTYKHLKQLLIASIEPHFIYTLHLHTFKPHPWVRNNNYI